MLKLKIIRLAFLIKPSFQSCLMVHPEILRGSRAIMLLYTSCSSFQGHVQWIPTFRFTGSLRMRRYSNIAVPKPLELSNYCSVINQWGRGFLMSIVCLRIEDRGSRIASTFVSALLLSSVEIFSFIYLFASHRMPSNLFQKLLLHLFNKEKSLG